MPPGWGGEAVGWCGTNFLREASARSDALAQTLRGLRIFALCEGSSILPEIKLDVIERVSQGTIRVTTDFEASPTGYPFKIVHRDADGEPAELVCLRARERVCDLGYPRQPYCKQGSDVGFRCPAEPLPIYVKKGGAAQDTVNKLSLCNQLLATVGLGQARVTRSISS